MKISFIGAGKVGFTLGKYFSINGLSVEGYFSKNIASSKEASEFVNCKYFESLESLVLESEIIIITTNDDSISDVWSDLKRLDLTDKIICHCSGSLSSDIFLEINNSGAFQYSIHPMYPFRDKYTSYENLKTAYFSLEGHPEKLAFMNDLLSSLGNNVINISKEEKGRYHLANVMVSNLVLSLIEEGVSTLCKCGVDEVSAKEALMPLILSNVENIKNQDFKNAITGPVLRCDIQTIKKHMACLHDGEIDVYKELSLNLVKIASQKNEGKDYKEVNKILGGS